MELVDETEAKLWEIDWLHYAIASDGLETPAITLPSENASSLDGEQLFQAAKYTLGRNKGNEFISNVFPREGSLNLLQYFWLNNEVDERNFILNPETLQRVYFPHGYVL